MLQTVRAKKCGHLSSFNVSILVSLNYRKKVYFLQFCADFSKNPKSAKAIYMYAFEKSRYTLSESHMVYMGLSHCS